jgi:hypothetical protein
MIRSPLLNVAVAASVVCFCAYAIYSGEIRGGWRSYSRREQPVTFWAMVIIALAAAVAILFGVGSRP